jgi:2-polyprenyl-6-methoxyphenol hydroxylase-like FAD-dependent oxidoreductase
LLCVENEVAAAAEFVKGIKIAGRFGKVLDIPFNNNLPHARFAPFIAIKRSILDSLLLRRAITDGATFHDATLVESIICRKSDRDPWNIRLRKNESGEIFDINCRTLIGADGRNSRVARLLAGINDEQDKVREAITDRIGVQFTVKRPNAMASDVLMFFFDGGYGGIVGVTADEANTAMVVPRSLARLAVTDFKSFIARTIHSNPYARRAVSGIEMTGEIRTAFPITPRVNKRKYPSAYLIGDARHTTEPFTGEGVFFAMQDGIRTAREVSKSLGLVDERGSISTRNRFWRDNIFSPVLQRESMTESLLALGLRYKSLARLALNMVIR